MRSLETMRFTVNNQIIYGVQLNTFIKSPYFYSIIASFNSIFFQLYMI